MGRIRTIKPSFFKHEELFEAEKASGLPLRVAFSGLWTVCDRDGRFAWKPRALKTDVMPYDELDFVNVLEALVKFGFVEKYTAAGREYGQVPTFLEHQVINPRESKSAIPCRDASPRVNPVTNPAHGEGKGREEEGNGGVITPEMVMRGVLSELSLSGRDLAVTLDEICRAEFKKGRDASELRDELIAAWREYDKAKPRLTYTTGAVKFFGEGWWANRAGWPWKPGESSGIRKPPPENKYLKELEETKRKWAAERGES